MDGSTIDLQQLLFKHKVDQKNWPWNPNSFELKEDLVWDSKTPTGLTYTWISCDKMVEVTPAGVFTVRKGFKWDGTTDVPDGPIDPAVGLPITWKASLIHDVCCDHYDDVDFPYKRSQFNRFFYNLLVECKFKWAKCYYFGVIILCWPNYWYKNTKGFLGYKVRR